MVDIKAFQEVIDYLANHEDAQSYIITAEELRTEKRKLEKAIQGAQICTVPYSCNMLEEHITGGGEHADIEERLCCLEAGVGLAQERIKALMEAKAVNGIIVDCNSTLTTEQLKNMMDAVQKRLQINASEQKSLPGCDLCGGLVRVPYRTYLLPDRTFCSRVCMTAATDMERKSEVATSTATLPEGAQVTQTASAENRCAQCNRPLSTEFGATYRTDAIPGEVYCSAQCGWEAATDRLERPQARQCDQCGADIEVLYETHLLPKRMFCSWECMTIATDRPKTILMSDDDPTPEYRGPRCDRCNAPLGFNAYSSGALPGKIFCGAECAWKAETEQRLEALERSDDLHDKVLGELSSQKYDKCVRCNGMGFIVVGEEVSWNGTKVDLQICQKCRGSGGL